MKKEHNKLFLLLSVVLFTYSTSALAQKKEMMVRISEIEVYPAHLSAYKEILIEEAEASLRLEPGVLAIFPMYEKDNATKIKILEMYEDQAAYQAHLKTPHFLKYKTTTLKMVKSLKLVDMNAIDPKVIPAMFRKVKPY